MKLSLSEFLHSPNFLMPTLYYTSVKENLFLFLHTGLYALLWFECPPQTQQGRFHCFFEILSFRMLSWSLEVSRLIF